MSATFTTQFSRAWNMWHAFSRKLWLLSIQCLAHNILLHKCPLSSSGFHLENCLGGGGNWRNLDFKGGRGGGMMVTDVSKFHKRHLGGWGMLECVCVCVCRFHTGF